MKPKIKYLLIISSIYFYACNSSLEEAPSSDLDETSSPISNLAIASNTSYSGETITCKKTGKKIPHGEGVLIFKNGKKTIEWTGRFNHGLLEEGGDNRRLITYKGGFKHEEGKQPKYHGQGCLTFNNGTICKGSFSNGLLEDGTITYPSGNTYTGNVKQNQKEHVPKPHGGGVFFIESNGNKCEGIFENGFLVRNEEAVISYENGDVYEGSVNENLEPHGTGILHYPDGTALQGPFSDGSPVFPAVTKITDDPFFMTIIPEKEKGKRPQVFQGFSL